MTLSQGGCFDLLWSVNRLYFGDNLEWLRDRREFPDATIDLVYLDPPFNSNADYNFQFTI